MHSEIELKSFELIDKFLQHLVDNGNGSYYDIDKNDQHSPECHFAFKLMCDKELISFRKGYVDKNSIIDIASNGLSILKIGGYKKYLDDKKRQSDNAEYVKNLEIEKTKTDLELAKKMLKEYPMTKWTARIGFFIALSLALLELIKYLQDR